MKLVAVLLLSAILVSSEAFLFSSCSTDKDCGAEQCCVHGFPSTRCVDKKTRLALCSLSGSDSCGCASGLVCADPASLDLALETSGSTQTGRCELASKVHAATTAAKPA